MTPHASASGSGRRYQRSFKFFLSSLKKTTAAPPDRESCTFCALLPRWLMATSSATLGDVHVTSSPPPQIWKRSQRRQGGLVSEKGSMWASGDAGSLEGFSSGRSATWSRRPGRPRRHAGDLSVWAVPGRGPLFFGEATAGPWRAACPLRIWGAASWDRWPWEVWHSTTGRRLSVVRCRLRPRCCVWGGVALF